MHPDEFQTPFKASFFLEDQSTVPHIGRALRRKGIRCRLVYSGRRFLDAMPERAGKRAAIDYLMAFWGVLHPTVLACGDTWNDLDMIEDPRFLGVIVGNSEDRMHTPIEADPIHLSSLPYAAGVLEGAEAFISGLSQEDVRRSQSCSKTLLKYHDKR